MGRTKQSCRKASNGMANMEQMACSSSTTVRQYMNAQQATGASVENKNKIFVNCDNTFASFYFNRPLVSSTFQPVAQLARFRGHSSDPTANPALFMRMDFASNLDGNQAAVAESRPPLDAIFSLDASGSMGSPFPIDASNRNKLEVAKQCILEVCAKLTPKDRIGITSFDTNTKDVFPLQYFQGDQTIDEIKAAFYSLSSGGGTNLSVGLNGGFNALGVTAEPRMRRVFFLTDMESDIGDEQKMIQYAHEQARKTLASYLTVVGIGVDLSIDTVERISGVQGAKYISVMNAQELQTTVVQDFDFDVLPIAFNIQVSLPVGLTVAAGGAMGSTEIANIPANSSTFTISAEFPVPFAALQQSMGGLYLFRLNEQAETFLAGSKSIHVTWQDLQGERHAADVAVALPPALEVGQQVTEGYDVGLRKAVALARYVQSLTAYSTATNNDAVNNDYDDVFGFNNNYGGMQQAMPIMQQQQQYISNRHAPQSRYRNLSLRQNFLSEPPASPQKLMAVPAGSPPAFVDGWSTESIVSAALLTTAMLPSNWSTSLKQKAIDANIFEQLSMFLRSEILGLCGDASILPGGSNANVLQTVEQIRDVEKNEVEALLHAQMKLSPPQPALAVAVPMVAAEQNRTADTSNMICPLLKTMMRDPVIAADGHTYDRIAIETYLLTSETSPVTGQKLDHKMLVPNLQLRAAIQNHVALSLAGKPFPAPVPVNSIAPAALAPPAVNDEGEMKRRESCTMC